MSLGGDIPGPPPPPVWNTEDYNINIEQIKLYILNCIIQQCRVSSSLLQQINTKLATGKLINKPAPRTFSFLPFFFSLFVSISTIDQNQWVKIKNTQPQ